MDAAKSAEQHVAEALTRLEAKRLVSEPSDVFSMRIPGEPALAVAGLPTSPPRTRTVRFNEVAVVEAACAVHATLYLSRGDAGAILTARLAWASRLAQFSQPMPAVFDEQVRQLGVRVERLTLSGSDLGEPGAKVLERGANAFLLGAEVVVMGFTPERAVLNAELLEKCAKAYVLARLAGGQIRPIPWLVRFIAARRLRKDQCRAAQAHARGEMPDRFSTY